MFDDKFVYVSVFKLKMKCMHLGLILESALLLALTVVLKI